MLEWLLWFHSSWYHKSLAYGTSISTSDHDKTIIMLHVQSLLKVRWWVVTGRLCVNPISPLSTVQKGQRLNSHTNVETPTNFYEWLYVILIGITSPAFHAPIIIINYIWYVITYRSFMITSFVLALHSFDDLVH